jgi:hypothetical protein
VTQRDGRGRFISTKGTIVAPLPKQSKESKRMNELLRSQRSYAYWTSRTKP